MPTVIASMTGFARAEGRIETPNPCTWAWEAKSVNSKGLDVRFRVPQGFEELESIARGAASQKFTRGAITLTLTIARESAQDDTGINIRVLDALIALARDKSAPVANGDTAPVVAPARLDGLMSLAQGRESQETIDQATRDHRNTILIAGLNEALDTLAKVRQEEGKQLTSAIDGHVSQIDKLTQAARELSTSQPDALKARLKAQVSELLDASPGLAEDRLAQEAALLALKFDIREELDRLKAHVSQARDLLTKGEPCGRRLDFLCQEFNREANTLCSKSSDVEMTRIGLDLKSTIDQLREQIQNIE